MLALRVLAHPLGHGGWDHLQHNLMLFSLVGPPCERHYGSEAVLKAGGLRFWMFGSGGMGEELRSLGTVGKTCSFQTACNSSRAAVLKADIGSLCIFLCEGAEANVKQQWVEDRLDSCMMLMVVQLMPTLLLIMMLASKRGCGDSILATQPRELWFA